MSAITLAMLLTTAAAAPVDFDTDVLPILTKAGCNAASCHGSAAGRGGFKLSLFAGDPAADHTAIVHQLEGRRVNYVHPKSSLLIAKPTWQLDHEGGLRFDFDSPESETLAQWIAEGATRRRLRRLVRLEIEPEELVLAGPGEQVQVNVTAVFDDGSRRAVGHRAVYSPDDSSAVEADGQGALVVRRRGRHVVVVRYLSEVSTVQVTVPLSDEPVDLDSAARSNWIDDEVLAMLKTLRLAPSPPADDATLLRRLRLDLTGRLPTPGEVAEYTADRRADKYARLVDRLLDGDEFVDYWTFRFAALLRLRGGDPPAAHAFHGWIREQIKSNAPLDQMARTLLLAEGDTHEVGPANFYRAAGDARAQAEYTSEVLLGVRLRCANCHNHPLDRWTQDDYHGLAAIFARMERSRIVRLGPRGEVTNPRTGEAAVPRIPGDKYLEADGDGRDDLADWLTQGDNPYFAKAMVNRLWKAMLGRGLIEPTDDLRQTNPATHPRLLARLAEDFVAHGANLRHTLRTIALSATYQRSAVATSAAAADDRFYSHALTKPLEAEVLADAIADVTGIAEKFGEQPKGTRAVTLVDPATPSAALDVLGRCSRQETCETSPGGSGGLTTRLHLMNGALLNARIASDEGRLRQQLAAGRTSDEVVRGFYIRALGRQPRDEEAKYWKTQLAAPSEGERRRRLEDFLWSLLSCQEFTTNH
ncbi:MAG: DUF1553 domain-containing protein [Pirellulaceae bacterium]